MSLRDVKISVKFLDDTRKLSLRQISAGSEGVVEMALDVDEVKGKTGYCSVVDFVDLSGAFGKSPNPQSTKQWSQTEIPIAERGTKYDQQRPTPQVIPTTYFPVDDPYDFNTGDGRGDQPDSIALTPSDPKDLALSDEEKARKPSRRRNRLQRRAKAKSRAEVEDDDDMERLPLFDERAQDALPRGDRRGADKRLGTSKKPSAKGRHIKFLE
ncbi:hypothetical protein DSL72_000480 [Monilinia vaccinii-corymbosi]|uniref:Uncharacterized protein n=1 Tax=Monilinia vaccinii-corymbosi TaxID=61207 RepID=A0A8A3P1Q3_9HELO|nr:hypothetical protein DSL72_000480 [Monilinia vaccinii-corymbosi]